MAEPGRTATQADDDMLLGRLARTLGRVDPVPAPLVAGAAGLLTWRTVDAELAELLGAGLAAAPE